MQWQTREAAKAKDRVGRPIATEAVDPALKSLPISADNARQTANTPCGRPDGARSGRDAGSAVEAETPRRTSNRGAETRTRYCRHAGCGSRYRSGWLARRSVMLGCDERVIQRPALCARRSPRFSCIMPAPILG